MDRVSVYIDGSNFEYGLKQAIEIDSVWKHCYWLDFIKLFELFVPRLDVKKGSILHCPADKRSKKKQAAIAFKSKHSA